MKETLEETDGVLGFFHQHDPHEYPDRDHPDFISSPSILVHSRCLVFLPLAPLKGGVFIRVAKIGENTSCGLYPAVRKLDSHVASNAVLGPSFSFRNLLSPLSEIEMSEGLPRSG
jgi:hypothetical protein